MSRFRRSKRPAEDEALEAFAKSLYERFEWGEYPLILHWCKVLNMTKLREQLIDLAFSGAPPTGERHQPPSP